MILETFQDQVDVTTNVPQKDKTWHRIHPCGQVLTWETIEWWVDSLEWCDDCHEDHEDGHWVCPKCLEKVEPEMRPPSGIREYVPGMTHYLIDGREVPPEEFARALATVTRGL